MANAHYPTGLKAFADGEVDFLDDDIRCVLLDEDASYSASDEFLDDVNSDQVAMSDALASKTSTGGTLDADNPTFTALTGDPVASWVLIKWTGDAATSRLLAWFDTKADTTAFEYTPNGADFTLVFSGSGIMEI